MEVTGNKQGNLNIIIGALVGVLALLAYLFIGSRNETLEVQRLLTTKVEQLASTQVRLDSLSKVLDEKIAEVRQLGGSLTKLEKIRRQLETDKQKLKYDLNFSLQQYNLKIGEYNEFLAQNDVEIRKLRREYSSLLSRARVLEQEKQTILNENEGLKQEKEVLAQTVVDYSRQNADLTSKVTLASAMQAVNVAVLAVAPNGRERTGSSYKASRIDRLKITFVMPSNPVAVKNNKDIYVRILDANGAVVSDNGIGGVTWVEGREIGYSTRQTVPFENNDQHVDILFRRDAPYKPGAYQVELYAEGFKIGSGSFEVK
ncbi:hypothetical protein GCM10023189_49290 [Nibrella saemangeumensis]|uniref:Uncharacterized protein n=1 Tax=Nibrella saemangeumensis TaxID=1084526 RepID=A0ABP8NG85_9BACT